MTLFDFFQASELPAPAVSTDDAVMIAREHFRLDATASPLGSQQDANFLLTAADGKQIGVLKIANPAFSRVEIEAQDPDVFLRSSESLPDGYAREDTLCTAITTTHYSTGQNGHTRISKQIAHTASMR